jgi:hypothetical protein
MRRGPSRLQFRWRDASNTLAGIIIGMEPAPRAGRFIHEIVFGERRAHMRLILLVLVVLLGIDAYAFSGAYTQYVVREVSTGMQRLAARIDPNPDSERPAPPRPSADRGAG